MRPMRRVVVDDSQERDLRTCPENRAVSKATLTRSETAALRMSRFSAMVPFPSFRERLEPVREAL